MPDFSVLTQFAQFGAIGLALGLFVLLFFWRDKALVQSWSERLADLQKLSALIQADTAAQLAATKAQEERNRAIEALATAQQQMARTIEMAHTQNSQKFDMLIRELTLVNARADQDRHGGS